MEAEERAITGAPGGKGGGGPERTLLTLVVPTRNEAENVPRLVRELRESLSGVDYRVVFVDDSTDETPGMIRALADEDEQIFLVHREWKERDGGLSTAVTTGMELFSGASEYTCVMDADLQHPPEKVREMLEIAHRSDADVVVASRYAPGGSYEGLFGRMRRTVSVGSKYLAQIVFKEARKTSDPLTGFFLARNEAISGIQFRPMGFKILLEILVCAPELKVVETPFDFRTRNAGVSKASMRQGLDYLTHLMSLFWYVPSAGRFWKFAVVGASGVLVNMVTLVVLAEYFDAHKVIAWMFAVGQLPAEQRFHVAGHPALEQDPFLPAWRPGLPGRRHGHRGELRRLVPTRKIRLRRLPILCDLQPSRHSRRHERELYPLLEANLPSIGAKKPRPGSLQRAGS